MPIYDDEKTRKDNERLEEILKNFKKPTNEDFKIISENLLVIEKGIMDLQEKQKYEGLTKEERLYLDVISEKLEILGQSISDIKLILGQKIFADALKIMEAYRKAGEEGNAEAQKSYEKLYASWLKIQAPKKDQNN